MGNKATYILMLLSAMMVSSPAYSCRTPFQQQYGFTPDSADIKLITKYLRDQHGAISVSENEDASKEVDLLWESGPYKIESKETLKAFERGYRFYAVCSAVHGIPAPSFRMVLMIDPRNEIIPVKYDDHTIFNQCLIKKRNAQDLKVLSAAIMTVLSHQHCIGIMATPKEIKITKKNSLYYCHAAKGTGYRKKGAAYTWSVQFDQNLNCVKAEFVAGLPPVP